MAWSGQWGMKWGHEGDRVEVPGVTDGAERLAQVSDDIDKQPRRENPDIGADEQ